jgi:DNA polymerase-1
MASRQLHPVIIDFETDQILARPQYPPVPCGVSIKYYGKPARYYAWGHPSKNNCTLDDAKRALRLAWACEDGVACHHLKFDYDVGITHMGMPELPWHKLHCTMILLFLDNPHAEKLALKPSAERLLGMPPEEQENMRDWLIENQPVPDVRVTKTNFGAYICHAPGDLVGKYADGDVIRTEKLFNLLMPSIKKRKMTEAYDRERKLIPILLEIERQGVRVSTERLWCDVQMYDQAMCDAEKWLRKKLKVDAEFNLDADQQLIHALADAGLLDLKTLGTTPKSKPEKPTYRADAASMAEAITDPAIAGVMKYRSQLSTCLNTFMKPWLETAMKSGGLIFTQWNQIRSEKNGARTGRFSSSPNFQNIPTLFKSIWKHEAQLLLDACTDEDECVKLRAMVKSLPKMPLALQLPALPMCRSYIIPYKPGHVLLDRDFSSQELRILAHFEDGAMQAAYNENPKLDLHQYAADVISATAHVNVSRTRAKTIAFSILYGSGLKHLSEGVGCSVDEARQLRDAYLNTFKGVRTIMQDMKVVGRENKPIRTVGGREYFCEPPKLIDGRMQTYDFKLLNYLIQGSAADLTKDAMIRFWDRRGNGLLLLTVHDEILVSAPIKDASAIMKELQECMNESSLDVPMLSDGERGDNWGEMCECD